MMLLWIRRDFSTRSAVYVRANWLDKDCIEPAWMLEKKRLVFSKRVSAHPILWIFSGLSTVEPTSRRKSGAHWTLDERRGLDSLQVDSVCAVHAFIIPVHDQAKQRHLDRGMEGRADPASLETRGRRNCRVFLIPGWSCPPNACCRQPGRSRVSRKARQCRKRNARRPCRFRRRQGSHRRDFLPNRFLVDQTTAFVLACRASATLSTVRGTSLFNT